MVRSDCDPNEIFEFAYQRTIRVGLPGKVVKNTSSKIDALDTHALQVVQCVPETISVTTVTKLCTIDIMLPGGSVSTRVSAFSFVLHM